MQFQNMNRKFEIMINTCDAYSDLWDGNTLLLNKNWGDRSTRTVLVTDRVTDKRYPDIEILSAGEGKEITERLKTALDNVQAEYILLLMDDYFLTEPISSDKINHAIAFMDAEQIDYLRLYPATKHYLRREGARLSEEFGGFYIRNLSKGDYKVSLYPGLWRTDFIRKTVETKLNAWQYEVELTAMARGLNARCAISNNGELPFLDVIRKGKVLRKAHRYFQENPVYVSEREVMRARDEWMLSFRTFLRHWLPELLFRAAKHSMIRCGQDFYSPLADKNQRQ